MRTTASTGIFLRAFNLARRSGLLDQGWFRHVFLFSYFRYKRWYEDPFWALVKSHPELFAGGHVLDVGANIGYTASVFAGAIRPPSKVYAFEPDQASFATLTEIVHRKRLSESIELFNVAVGAREGVLDFWHNDEHSADHRVVTSQFKSAELDSSKITTVRVTSVDDFVTSRGLNNVSFIKIDVQGYELAVCEGMKETLEKSPQLSVALEYAPDGIRELGFEPAALLQFFRSRGYHLHVLSRGGLQPAADDAAIALAAQRSGYVDLLCSKKALL